MEWIFSNGRRRCSMPAGSYKTKGAAIMVWHAAAFPPDV
jgi:hypothetical protein